MPKFDATINGKSLASYGITPTTATVPQPDAKTYQADIPGRDGMLDYTDAFGVIRYDNRTVTVEAYEIGDIATRIDHRRAICSDMHGMSCKLSLSTLDGYTFSGRCNVEYEEDGSQTAYTLSFDCEPYMSAGERTFVGNCAGGADLIFISGDKPVKPRIEVPRRSIVVFDGNQYEVDKGTWTFDGIIFKRGRNEIYINTYTEPGTTTWGDLQSMTWEQIAWNHQIATASGDILNIDNALKARASSLTVDGKSAQDGTPTPDAPVEVDVVDGPVSIVVSVDNTAENGTTYAITLPADHDYLASLPDGTHDELVLRSDGVAVLTERVLKRVLNGTESWLDYQNNTPGLFGLNVVSNDPQPAKFPQFTVQSHFSKPPTINGYSTPKAMAIDSLKNLWLTWGSATTTTAIKSWLASNPVTMYYALANFVILYSADNGATWSTTDPAAGTSAIPLQKGTNNVWCTDRLSPTITLDYNTQERTRKRRISELYWMGNEPKKRLTWGQLATHTWKEIGSKSIQEWYFSGTAEIVENAYINYEIGEL